jgi:hypothetical protein
MIASTDLPPPAPAIAAVSPHHRDWEALSAKFLQYATHDSPGVYPSQSYLTPAPNRFTLRTIVDDTSLASGVPIPIWVTFLKKEIFKYPGLKKCAGLIEIGGAIRVNGMILPMPIGQDPYLLQALNIAFNVLEDEHSGFTVKSGGGTQGALWEVNLRNTEIRGQYSVAVFDVSRPIMESDQGSDTCTSPRLR